MTELFSAVENNHEITDITDAYYKIIIQNVDRVCRQLTIHLSDDSDNNLFDISATLLHKYLKFRESMNDFESIATVCADFENLDNSSNNQSTSSRRLKQSINKVIIIIATLLFLAGKICESLVSMKLCVELSYKELLPNSRIDNLKVHNKYYLN